MGRLERWTKKKHGQEDEGQLNKKRDEQKEDGQVSEHTKTDKVERWTRKR